MNYNEYIKLKEDYAGKRVNKGEFYSLEDGREVSFQELLDAAGSVDDLLDIILDEYVAADLFNFFRIIAIEKGMEDVLDTEVFHRSMGSMFEAIFECGLFDSKETLCADLMAFLTEDSIENIVNRLDISLEESVELSQDTLLQEAKSDLDYLAGVIVSEIGPAFKAGRFTINAVRNTINKSYSNPALTDAVVAKCQALV